MTSIDQVIERLEGRIVGYGSDRALVAFSGGVDSAVVLAVAGRALGRDRVRAVTAVSPSYPAGELEAARDVAASLGISHRTVRTGEVGRDAYARNDGERCFHCKTELYGTLGRLVRDEGRETVVLAGANADDQGDFRPGLRAADQQGVRNPLLEEAVGKPTVRAVARSLGLSVAEKPALACLSSRVAFGVRITPDLLDRIDRAEQEVRGLGVVQARVRHFGDHAVIEVPRHDVARLTSHPSLQQVLSRIRSMGWRDVVVDPEGYRPGRMNATLIGVTPSARPAVRKGASRRIESDVPGMSAR